MNVSKITAPESLDHDLQWRKSGRSESSLNQEPVMGGNANELEPDPISHVEMGVDFNLDDWNSQVIGPDLPLDLAWPLLDIESLPPFPASNIPSDISLTPSFTRSASILGPLVQDYQTATTSFPDTYLLPIPALTLMRACLTNATRLGIVFMLWDSTSISPFYTGGVRPNFDQASGCSATSTSTGIDIATLPENLRPTRTQQLLPHHPLIDILPWPTVRNKLIMFFAQPEELRPAQLGMEQLVEDFEDEVEGVVVKAGGAEPWEAHTWEVGKALEKRWWFVLDGKVKRRR